MGKDEKPQVMISEVKLGEVWDKKAASDAPDLAAKALKDGLGRDVDVVSSKPKSGYIIKPTLDLEFDEDRGTFVVRVSAVVTNEKNSLVAAIKTSNTQKKIDEAEAKKKLKTLVTAVAKGAGADCATEIAKAAKDR